MQLLEEQELIKGCLENQRQAQYLLYKTFYEQFIRVCRRYIKSECEAKEVLNTAFYKIFSKIHSYAGSGNFTGWMQKIVVNTALDYIKSNKKYSVEVDLEEAEHFSEHKMENSFHPNDLLNMLHSLPENQLQVFNLFAMEGYSHAEIAEQLNISEANSKWLLFNARKKLQALVNQHD